MTPSTNDEAWEKRHRPEPRRVQATATEADDDGQDVVGLGRVGGKAQLSVKFCLRTGGGKLFSYSHLYSVDFKDASELVLTFSSDRVTVTGWNLGRLLDYLADHKARVIREGELNEAKFKGAETGIESITIEPLGQ